MSDSDSFSSDDEFLPMILLEVYQMTDDNFNFDGNQYVSLKKQQLYYVNIRGLTNKAKQIAYDESFITGSNHNIDTHEDQHKLLLMSKK
ncbi:unnamed protein product [Rhizophagus irregularis]|nr:unnamed protein product [Rhizophagus irregularis]